MANEEISGIIQQLGEIGTLIGQFSEIAAEMKKAMNGAVSCLKTERTNIEEAVKGITTASNKWESKINSVSKDVNEISSKILSFNSSISNINKLLDEKIQPVKDFSEACSSIMEMLKQMSGLMDRLITVVEGAVPSSDIADRLDRIERAFEIREQRDKQMEEAIKIIMSAVTDEATTGSEDSPLLTDNSGEAVTAEKHLYKKA